MTEHQKHVSDHFPGISPAVFSSKLCLLLKFHETPPVTFLVILPTNKHTRRHKQYRAKAGEVITVPSWRWSVRRERLSVRNECGHHRRASTSPRPDERYYAGEPASELVSLKAHSHCHARHVKAVSSASRPM